MHIARPHTLACPAANGSAIDHAGPPVRPIVHATPTGRALAGARLAIAATVLTWLGYVGHSVWLHLTGPALGEPRTLGILVVAIVGVTLLTFSALMYLVARLGAMHRLRGHVRVPRAELDEHFSRHRSTITVLVPSYAEEPRVVRTTLWSAVLQEFPATRVVLLLDDPPHPTDPTAAARLERTRQLATEIQWALQEPYTRAQAARARFAATASNTTPADVAALAAGYDDAAAWLHRMAAAEPQDDHTEVFFVSQVLGGLAGELGRTATSIRDAADTGSLPSRRRLLQLHTRLVRIFQAELSVFERKRYASLSHEANKAMNLNSYLSLMGGAWVEDPTPAGLVLRPACPEDWPDLVVPDSDYVLTLDASRCCCASTACASSTSWRRRATSGWRSSRPRIRPTRAPRPSWNGWLAPPRTCNTSSTRARPTGGPPSGWARTR